MRVPFWPGDRQPVVERGEPGPVGEAEGGDEGVAGDPVAAVESGAVVERAVGDRHAELLELGRDGRDAGGGGALLRRSWTPSSLVSSSAVRLSLDASIDATMSRERRVT